MKYLKYIVPVVVVLIILLTWKMWADNIGLVVASVLGFLGLGGASVSRKVKRRAKKKAEQVPYTDPQSATDDINRRLRKR